jgi:tetratricopeptide (TPR) repeat protein
VFTAAIQKHPTYAAAYGNRGAAYTAQKKFNLALDDLKKGIELNPTDPFAVGYRLEGGGSPSQPCGGPWMTGTGDDGKR